jgi:hypothetical protein
MSEPTIYISTDGSVPSQRYAIDDPAIVEALAIAQAARDAGMVDEHGRFRKILGTLPITADGCVVGENAMVWFYDDDDRLTSADVVSIEADNNEDRFHLYGRDCYSTRSAAEAAKGGGE